LPITTPRQVSRSGPALLAAGRAARRAALRHTEAIRHLSKGSISSKRCQHPRTRPSRNWRSTWRWVLPCS
jgi:hypothetical protein